MVNPTHLVVDGAFVALRSILKEANAAIPFASMEGKQHLFVIRDLAAGQLGVKTEPQRGLPGQIHLEEHLKALPHT